MSGMVIAFAVLSLFLLLAIVWLVLKPLPKEAVQTEVTLEELVPMHSQHFPQLRQALASADVQYVRRKTSKEVERQWREERRRILQAFLDGVVEDFVRLDQLARLIASHSPHFSRREELERAWLSLRFRFGYRIMSMRIASGSLGSVRQMSRLTGLVGNLSARAEAAMARLEIASPRVES
jgi:Na+-transporting methylmalonyl-CoA/oxaloacetate decarboxylase gamma subunit